MDNLVFWMLRKLGRQEYNIDAVTLFGVVTVSARGVLDFMWESRRLWHAWSKISSVRA